MNGEKAQLSVFFISIEITDKGKTPNERDLHTNFTVILWFLYFDICAVSESSYEEKRS